MQSCACFDPIAFHPDPHPASVTQYHRFSLKLLSSMQVFAQVGEEQHVRNDDRCCSCMSFTASTVKTPLYPGTPQAALQQHREGEPVYYVNLQIHVGFAVKFPTRTVIIMHISIVIYFSPLHILQHFSFLCTSQ